MCRHQGQSKWGYTVQPVDWQSCVNKNISNSTNDLQPEPDRVKLWFVWTRQWQSLFELIVVELNWWSSCFRSWLRTSSGTKVKHQLIFTISPHHTHLARAYMSDIILWKYRLQVFSILSSECRSPSYVSRYWSLEKCAVRRSPLRHSYKAA